MRKSKLIEMLNNIKGNPEIVLWNGMVGDYMDISPKVVEGDLVRTSFETYLRHVEFEQKRDRNDFDYKMSESEVEDLRKSYRKDYKWEQNDFVTKEDVKSGMYKSKRVFYIDAKPRGVTTFDRQGNLSY